MTSLIVFEENVFSFNTESYSDEHEGNYISNMSFYPPGGFGYVPFVLKKKPDSSHWEHYSNHEYGDDLLDWILS